MVETIQLKYINESLQIGFCDIRQLYLLQPEIKQLQAEVYKGSLVYRAKGSGKRISYKQIKKGLKKTTRRIEFEVPSWLY